MRFEVFEFSGAISTIQHYLLIQKIQKTHIAALSIWIYKYWTNNHFWDWGIMCVTRGSAMQEFHREPCPYHYFSLFSTSQTSSVMDNPGNRLLQIVWHNRVLNQMIFQSWCHIDANRCFLLKEISECNDVLETWIVWVPATLISFRECTLMV